MLEWKHGAISIEMRGSVERMLQVHRASGAYQSRRIGSVEGAHRLAQNSTWRKPKSQKAESKSSGWYFQRRIRAPVQKSIKRNPFYTSKIMQSDSRQLVDFSTDIWAVLRTACMLVGLFPSLLVRQRGQSAICVVFLGSMVCWVQFFNAYLRGNCRRHLGRVVYGLTPADKELQWRVGGSTTCVVGEAKACSGSHDLYEGSQWRTAAGPGSSTPKLFLALGNL